MLHVFYGSDTIKLRTEALKKLGESNLEIKKIDKDTFYVGAIEEAVMSVSLFGDKRVFLIDSPSEDAIFLEEFNKYLSEVAESSELFVVIEGPLLAGPKKILEKVATSMEEYKASAGSSFDPFTINNALVEKDKKSLWLCLLQAKNLAIPAEEIIGIIWWQLKTLRLATITKTAEEAGVKDFPYNKAKRALKNFKPGEIETLSTNLLKVYHDGHSGERDIYNALEEWALRI